MTGPADPDRPTTGTTGSTGSGHAGSGSTGSGHAGQGRGAVPYLCPFCGEEDLRPADGPDRQPRWHCRSCLRLFSLTFHGLAGPEASTISTHRAPEWSDENS